MKKEMTRRFMHLYKLFRKYKYGERISKTSFGDEFMKSYIPQNVLETDGKIKTKLDQIEKYLTKAPDDDAISDLHTVNEDYDDEADDDLNPAAFVHNKKEYEDHVF